MATIASYNANSPSGSANIYALDSYTSKIGESFTVSGNWTLTSAAVTLSKSGSVSGNIYLKVYAHAGTYGSSSVPTGSPLAVSDPIAASTLATYSAFSSKTFTFSGSNQIVLRDATKYVLTVEPDNPSGIVVNVDTDSPTYGGNPCFYGSSSWSYGGQDMEFTVSGTLGLTLYWVGGSGSWSDASHWSLSSGGAGGAAVPTSSDQVTFDSNSSASPFTVTVPSFSYLASLNCSALTSAMTLSGSALNVYGNITLSSLVTASSQLIVPYGAYSNVTANGATLNTLTVKGTATAELFDNLHVGHLGIGVVSADRDASLITNGYTILADSIFMYACYIVDLMDSSVFVNNLTCLDIGSTGFFITADAVVHMQNTNLTGTYDGAHLDVGGRDLGTVHFEVDTTIRSSNTLDNVVVDEGVMLTFQNGTTQTVTNLVSHGTDANKVLLRSDVEGSKWSISKASGTVDAYFLDIKDSTATGGATWNAYGSLDSGNNSGWNFLTPTLYPPSIPSAEAFGATTVKPGPSYLSVPSIPSAEAFGLARLIMFLSINSGIASQESFGTPTATQSPPPPPSPPDWSAIGKEDKKEYLYKVSDADGNYLGVWQVSDEPEFTQALNTPGTTMTVQLPRSANSTKELRSSLLTQAGDVLVTQDGAELTITYVTPNTVGEDTDVDLNYNVDVYVQYGGFENLITQSGELLVTQDDEQLVVTYGSPLGTRIFSGYILDYTSSYGSENGVTVTLSSHGAELSQEVIRSGSTTTVNYPTTELSTIVKSVLDTNPGKLTYDANSIATTGVSRTMKFQLNTKLEGIRSVYNQTPDGWYWYGNVADNLLYLQPKATTPHHVFLLGHHIKSIEVKRSLENLVNAVWFVGGGDPPVFKYYEDSTSQTTWRKGIDRITDRRYSLTDSMAGRANKEIGTYKNPIFTTPLVISAGRYDIETIHLGQIVGFGNFGNFIDALQLQIVNLSYTPTQVTLELGGALARQVDIINDIQSDLANDQYETIPDTPS